MKYRNTKTGVIIEIACAIGGDWEEIPTPAKPAPQAEEEKPVKKSKTAKKK